jgi:hypothetical protein
MGSPDSVVLTVTLEKVLLPLFCRAKLRLMEFKKLTSW